MWKTWSKFTIVVILPTSSNRLSFLQVLSSHTFVIFCCNRLNCSTHHYLMIMMIIRWFQHCLHSQIDIGKNINEEAFLFLSSAYTLSCSVSCTLFSSLTSSLLSLHDFLLNTQSISLYNSLNIESQNPTNLTVHAFSHTWSAYFQDD